MPRRNRNNFECGTFHIMVQGLNKSYIFNNEELKIIYIKLINKYKDLHDINIVAYCIMDNHAHFIINTKNMKEISKFMHDVNTIYSKFYNEKFERVGYVFRDRFKSQNIDSYNYLITCIKYIHMNPVNANIVKDESHYKFSSYNEYFCEKDIKKKKIISNYLKKEDIEILKSIQYKEIEVMDIDRSNEENLETAIKEFLNDKKLILDEVKNNKKITHELVKILKEKGYKQKDIGEKLGINEKKISRILKNK